MRGIKFRCWGKESKKWFYYNELDGRSLITPDQECSDSFQYTRLKDKNGKEIYEGDIISLLNPYDDVETKDFARVVFSYGYVGGWVATVDDKNFLNIGTRTKHVRVVGNIHETPELITA